MGLRKFLVLLMLGGVLMNARSCSFWVGDREFGIKSQASLSERANIAHQKVQTGDFQGALNDYNELVRVSPDAFTYTNRGASYAHLGNYAAAIADYDKAISLDSTWVDAYINRGSARGTIGQDYKGALADFDRAIQLDPKSVTAYSSRGAARRDSGDLEGAIQDSSQAIELNPQAFNAYHNRANSYFDRGNREAAIADLNQMIKIQPNSIDAYRQRAKVFAVSGDRVKALADYARILEIAKAQGDSGTVEKALEAMKQLQAIGGESV